MRPTHTAPTGLLSVAARQRPLPLPSVRCQAIRRCYDAFYIADCGRPPELRTIRVEKAAVLKRHVEDGVR